MKKIALLISLMLNSLIVYSRMHVKVDGKSTLTIAYEEHFFKYINNKFNNLNNRFLDLEETFDNYEKTLKNNNKVSKANNARRVTFEKCAYFIKIKIKKFFDQNYQALLNQAKILDANINSIEEKKIAVDKLKQNISVESEAIFKNIASEKELILSHHTKELESGRKG